MSLKAGRVGVNPKDVNPVDGSIQPSSVDSYTKSQADDKFLSKSDASSTYLSKSDATSTYLSKTDAASTYLSKTDAASTYEATANAKYKAGDVISLTYRMVQGILTNGGKELYFCIDLDKPVTSGVTMTFSIGTFTVRGVGGYVVSSGSTFDTDYTVANDAFVGYSVIRGKIVKKDDTAFTGTNNTPVVVTFEDTASITLS